MEQGDKKPDLWNNDPSKWVFGIFYFNKDDKRIFPPKRLPFLGWTINFANPYSVLIFIGIILSIVLISYLN
ncbi:MAG: DUF5808 domain-containing protein [Bacteroidia bacterium]